ncbi:hypothetical protein D9757_010099 [Collybiopsis confluens]|uniref:Uncharacterized protein n=1 Tax=Collybiopsis confluens TaxID=2823264 RepID=A0A8H5GME5_9AGAR|nr:hypothetical protein D9757_010099 [Collybiopsis confluens]
MAQCWTYAADDPSCPTDVTRLLRSASCSSTAIQVSAMTEETIPLLADSSGIPDREDRLNPDDSSLQAKLAAEEEHNAIYTRFSNGTKGVIVALIAFCGLLPCTCIQ